MGRITRPGIVRSHTSPYQSCLCIATFLLVLYKKTVESWMIFLGRRCANRLLLGRTRNNVNAVLCNDDEIRVHAKNLLD